MKSVKRRALRHIKDRVENFVKTIALNANVISNMSPQTSALKITLPIKDVAEFITFDTEHVENVEKVDAFVSKCFVKYILFIRKMYEATIIV